MTGSKPAAVTIDRRQVLAHRVHVQGLDRADGLTATRARDIQSLGVLDLGIQDTGGGVALALADRLDAGDGPEALAAAIHEHKAGAGLATVWSFRGSPHLHRRRELARLAAGASWPLSKRDAVDRLGGGGAALRASDLEPLAGFATAIEVMASTVTEPMTNAEASAAVTAAVPDALRGFCKPCGVVHVYESLFRQAALPAGLELVPGEKKLTLAPMPGWKTFSPPSSPTAARKALASYLLLHGPSTESEAASLLGSSRAEGVAAWPTGLVPVRTGTRDAWFPERHLDDLRSAPEPDLVRLLPPYDPYLRGWDRDVLVPDRARQKEIWKAIGNPGAVLVDGEIAGTWRPKAAGRELTLTVAPFGKVTAKAKAAIEHEAGLVASLRGAADVRVAFA